MVKKINKKFTLIDNNTTSSQTNVTVNIPDNMSDVMVCYGRENGYQSFGGGIIYGSIYLDKPCYLEVYEGENIVGILYIKFLGSTIIYHRQSGNETIRVIIYGR